MEEYFLTTKYHVVIVPAFPWDDIKLDNFQNISRLMEIVSEIFRFQLSSDKLTKNSTALYSRADVSNEVPRLYDITLETQEKEKELSKEVGIELNIEKAFATEFAIELVSSSPSVFYKWSNNFAYNRVCQSLSGLLYNGMSRSMSYPAAVGRIIVCDDVLQAKAIATKYNLDEIAEALYVGGSKTPVDFRKNVFDFRLEPWIGTSLFTPIVTLKPELLRANGHLSTMIELSFLLIMIHSLGKFYSISRSIESVCALLEWSSWYMTDLFDNYEAKFCWIQRTFPVLKEVYTTLKKSLGDTFSLLREYLPLLKHLRVSIGNTAQTS